MKSTWVYVSMFLAGLALGIFLGARFIPTSTQETSYSYGKVKAKGENVEVRQVNPPNTLKTDTTERKGILKIFNKKKNENRKVIKRRNEKNG